MRAIYVAALMLASGPVHGAESIVGTWTPIVGECAPVNGMIYVGPKELVADEIACHFDDVSRTGDRVTWHGRCSDGQDRYPATVVAALYQERLTIAINGQGWTMAYRRCRRG